MAGNRQADPVDLAYAPGILMERSPRASKGRWIDGNNVRWRDALPEKMGGFLEEELVDEVGAAALIVGRVRNYLSWDALDGTNWIAVGTHRKLYLISNGILYNITPIRHVSTIVDGLSTIASSAIVTVNDVGHDASQGDSVAFTGAEAVGGITISGEYIITEILDLDHYTITHSAAASSTVSDSGGVVTAQYEISVGLESDGTLYGYGTGVWDQETYGTPRSTSTFMGFARVWSLDKWGEDLLASPNGGTLYWWDRTLGPNSRAVVRPNAPANIERMLVGPDGRHVIALGANLASTGVQDKMFVRWCVGDDFDIWLATAENDAGSKRLDVGSRLITAVKTRTTILIWSDKGLYVLSYVAGSDVYEVLFYGESVQIIAADAAVDVGGVIYFMGLDDYYRFDGTLSIMDCEIASYVFGSKTVAGINRQMQSKVHAHYNKEFNEVRWHFPANGSAENNRVACYNVVEKCWYPSDMARECASDNNGYYGKPLGFANGRMYLHEEGVDAGTSPMDSYLKGYEAEISTGGFVMKTHHLIPDFKELDGSVTVSMFGRKYPGQAVTTSSSRAVTSSTEVVGIGYRARQVGLHVRSNTLGDFWRMDMWRLVATAHGRR